MAYAPQLPNTPCPLESQNPPTESQLMGQKIVDFGNVQSDLTNLGSLMLSHEVSFSTFF